MAGGAAPAYGAVDREAMISQLLKLVDKSAGPGDSELSAAVGRRCDIAVCAVLPVTVLLVYD